MKIQGELKQIEQKVFRDKQNDQEDLKMENEHDEEHFFDEAERESFIRVISSFKYYK